ncbi:MAG: hypothetical protein KIS91_07775 [Anaerolineae bacterium]|nr:hypothetical protein [Anaerolineae bacterium]
MAQNQSSVPASPQRFPLMALALTALLAGLWGGLLRIGWAWPVHPPLVMGHGPLMVCGFLGTLIGVERAVALDRPWPWAAPALAGLGTLVLLAGGVGWLGPLLFSLGSAVLTLIFFVPRRPLHAYSATMALGAATWLVGNLLWLAGLPLWQVALWWAMFLVFTIAGERLELSRVLRLPPLATRLFVGVVAVLLTGLAVSVVEYDLGVRLLGVGMMLLAGWLARYDIARRTVRMTGLTRYIAAALLSGYVWLAVGGALAVVVGGMPAGPLYDATLHAVFVGFVLSMIFGHAPIIFPSVLRTPLVYTPWFYAPLVLLNASLLLRIAADLGGWFEARRVGGLLNEVALLLFLGMLAWSALRGRRTRLATGAPRPQPSQS